MQAQQIRDTFTDFFVARDHLSVASAPLTAPGDPTLLFTSAGMVPFKPFFLGEAQPPHHRLTSIQKCFRTTDIDEVGDASHLTMFEMLGNFSLGDYFKTEAQAWAWELVTDVLGIDPKLLVATVFTDDDFAYDQWKKIGLPDSKIYRYGEDQGNFWAAGPTGPCGPCSELHYDMRPGYRDDAGPAEASEKWLEIWNLVFMQWTRFDDGRREDLPAQSIDTGAGLERWAMMLQGKSNLYDTDLFAPLLDYVGERCSLEYATATDQQRRAMRVVAEHGRAMTFLIADGAIPGNEGRGYVLRRLIRRALYHADQLGLEAPILGGVAEQVRNAMGSGYPEVVEQQALVDQVLNQEENRFLETLATGRLLLEQQTIPLKRSFAEVTDEFIAIMPADIVSAAWLGELEWAVDDVPIRNRTIGDITINEVQDLARQALKGTMPTDQALAAARAASGRISGEEAFVLYDTYGIPRELTQAVAEAAGLTLDIEGFEAALADQQDRARQAAKFGSDAEAAAFAELDLASTFSGYHEITAGSQIAAIVRDGEPVAHASTGDQVSVVLDTTPFYAEGGGQVGDAGAITANGAQLEVSETRAFGDVIAHIGKVTAGQFSVGDQVEAQVDRSRRADTTRNHTATHLLHAALRNVLGDHVRQAGSLVAPDHLRFDYTQSEAPTPNNSPTSSASSAAASAKTSPSRPSNSPTRRPSSAARWPSSARNTPPRSASSKSATPPRTSTIASARNSAAAPTPPPPASSAASRSPPTARSAPACAASKPSPAAPPKPGSNSASTPSTTSPAPSAPPPTPCPTASPRCATNSRPSAAGSPPWRPRPAHPSPSSSPPTPPRSTASPSSPAASMSTPQPRCAAPAMKSGGGSTKQSSCSARSPTTDRSSSP